MRVIYKDQSILEKQRDGISLAKTAVCQTEKGGKWKYFVNTISLLVSPT